MAKDFIGIGCSCKSHERQMHVMHSGVHMHVMVACHGGVHMHDIPSADLCLVPVALPDPVVVPESGKVVKVTTCACWLPLECSIAVVWSCDVCWAAGWSARGISVVVEA